MAEIALELIGNLDHWITRADPPHLVQQVVLPHDGGLDMRLDVPMTITAWRLVWVTAPPAGLEAENKRLRAELDAIERECRDRLAGYGPVAAVEMATTILGHMGLSAGEDTDWDAAGYDA